MPQSVFFNFRRKLSRRMLLRGSGAAMALPWLSAMNEAFADSTTGAPPRRFVAITLSLGLHAENLFPKTAGQNYQTSLYLSAVDDLRQRMTVISGTSHPQVSGGHRTEASLLTAAPMSGNILHNTISLDQLMAKHLGAQTRFPSLVLGTSGGNSPSYTENGAMIPAEGSPARLFTRLFVTDTPADRARQAERAREGRSIMDLVADDTRALERRLGTGDRDRLDAYFTSVRELERRLAESELWAHRPKPQVAETPPVDIGNPNDVVGRQRLMSDVIRLALSTDSSRFITLHVAATNGVAPIAGVGEGYHSLSHHGLDHEKLAQLALVEAEIIRAWGDFLRSLERSQDHDASLLDHTAVLLTSNLGNASGHDNRNLPVLLAGGSFRHGQYLAFDRENNYPLPNLYVTLLQHTGLEHNRFGTSTGTITGLEF